MLQFSRLSTSLGVLTLCLGTTASVRADSGITADAGVDIATAYLWRGYVLADALCLQPSVTLGSESQPLSLGIWGSLAVQDRKTWEEADEIDVTLDWTHERNAMGRTWTIGLGSVAYMMPTAETTHTEEAYLSLAVDVLGSPNVEAFYDFDAVDAWYIRPSLAQEWAGDDLAGSIDAASGFSNYERAFGFHDAEVSGSVSWSSGPWTLGPTVGVSFTREAINPDTPQVWGLFGLHWTSAD